MVETAGTSGKMESLRLLGIIATGGLDLVQFSGGLDLVRWLEVLLAVAALRLCSELVEAQAGVCTSKL